LKKIISLIGLVILLAACQGSTDPQTTPTSLTTPTFTPTPTHTITPTASETPMAVHTPWAVSSLTSPDGAFTANSYLKEDHPSGIFTIEIRDQDDQLLWSIPAQNISPTDDPDAKLNYLQWSKDSTHLYFYTTAYRGSGGINTFWWNGYDLQKINVLSGEIQPVLMGEDLMSFAINPDEPQMVYMRRADQPNLIYLRDLSTGEEKTTPMINTTGELMVIGDLHWSQNGDKIVFQTQDSDGMIQTIVLNPLTMEQKQILVYLVYTYEFYGWTDDGQLEFLELNQKGPQIIHIDPENGTPLVIGTPTPSP